MDACSEQNCIKHISILNMSLGDDILYPLETIIEKKFPNNTLESLRLSNIKTRNEDFLYYLLYVLEENPFMKCLEFS